MKYNVMYGKYPFDIFLGRVDAPEHDATLALKLALKQYKGVVPANIELDKKLYYQYHPVVCPSISGDNCDSSSFVL